MLCVVFVPRLADIPRIADTAYRALCVLQRLISSGNATGTATSSATSSREPPDTDEISRMGLAVFQAIVAAVARRPSRAAMTAMVEGLVLASGEDSQDECAQAAADAIPLLLTPQGAPDEGNGMGRGKVARLEADGLPGRGECELSLDATGMLMRVVKIGGGLSRIPCNIAQHRYAKKRTHHHPKRALYYPQKRPTHIFAALRSVCACWRRTMRPRWFGSCSPQVCQKEPYMTHERALYQPPKETSSRLLTLLTPSATRKASAPKTATMKRPSATERPRR